MRPSLYCEHLPCSTSRAPFHVQFCVLFHIPNFTRSMSSVLFSIPCPTLCPVPHCIPFHVPLYPVPCPTVSCSMSHCIPFHVYCISRSMSTVSHSMSTVSCAVPHCIPFPVPPCPVPCPTMSRSLSHHVPFPVPPCPVPCPTMSRSLSHHVLPHPSLGQGRELVHKQSILIADWAGALLTEPLPYAAVMEAVETGQLGGRVCGEFLQTDGTRVLFLGENIARSRVITACSVPRRPTHRPRAHSNTLQKDKK